MSETHPAAQMVNRALLVIGSMLVGGAMSWGLMSLTYDYRIQANAAEINDLFVIAERIDERVVHLETEVLNEIAQRLASIETSLTFLIPGTN